MRLLFIRHGDPDYTIDGLTDKGKKEAQLLAGHIRALGIDEVYVSPLGRARITADHSLKELGLAAVTLDWLREFPALLDTEHASDAVRAAYIHELKTDEETGKYKKRIVWDILPSYFADHPELFDVNGWRGSDIAKASNAVEAYDHIAESFDGFLKRNGYERKGSSVYEVSKSNAKTIAFFCHFGITCVLLSRLWNVSPFTTLQFLCMAPTSVTEVVTEEREKGIAIFRTLRIGDISHLTMENEKPAFAARFCERFENSDERH